MKIRGLTWGVWGFGVVGQSVARFLHARGAQVSIYDHHPIAHAQELPYKIYQPDQLASFLEEQSQIVPSPGIDITNHYATYGNRFVAELDLFYIFFKKPIIAITGSVGKTTTTRLIALLLEKLGYSIALGGNIGTAMCDFLLDSKEYDYGVLEVSSFQLEYIKQFSPLLAIITPFHPNHLDRHKTIEGYRNAKLNLLASQESDTTAVVPETLHEYAQQYKPHIITYNGNELDPLIRYIPPITFVENLNILANVIKVLKIDPTQAVALLQKIHLQQEHRLEVVATINDIVCINDSKSTVPESTLAAVDFFKTKPIHLLLGGLSKGVSREYLIQALHSKVKRIYCFGQEAQQLHAWCQQYGIHAAFYGTLDAALHDAYNNAASNSVILLSPAGSSYDLFKNYEERGTLFKELVKNLSKSLADF